MYSVFVINFIGVSNDVLFIILDISSYNSLSYTTFKLGKSIEKYILSTKSPFFGIFTLFILPNKDLFTKIILSVNLEKFV